MITGLNHSGLVVEDLERSIHFYRDVIGLSSSGLLIETAGQYPRSLDMKTPISRARC